MKQRSRVDQLRRDIAQVRRRLHRLDRAALAMQLPRESPDWRPWADSETVRVDTRRQLVRLEILLRMGRKR